MCWRKGENKMSQNRKSGKERFKEKNGKVYAEKYKSWILYREVPSEGPAHGIPSDGPTHEILDWKHYIVHSLEVQ